MAANSRTATRTQKARTSKPEVTAAEAQEIEAEYTYVTAELCGKSVRVIPPGDWRQSWQRMLNQGQVDAFAETVIHADDIDVYYELDPTNFAFGEFIADAAEQAGESLGKSHGPAASSRRTRRR